MKYCKKCLMPDSKPFIKFDDEGVCNACRAHEKKKEHLEHIDWRERRKEFDAYVEAGRSKKAPFYDVLVPVSGGKDSIYQVHTALEKNLRVLAVNVDYGIKTEIGIENLNVVPKMGATLITMRPEQNFHNRMIRIGFEDFGDPDLMSHALLYAYPLWVAVNFSVPLVFEGENSAFEYGGDKISGQKNRIDRDWFYKYIVTKGITPDYISKNYDIPMERLKVYSFPEEELAQKDIKAIFLGYYFNWDSEYHLSVAMKYGFRPLPEPREGTFRNYVGIDEKINRIHQFMKVLKFGYGRATDHACEDIRAGRLTRKEAIALVRKHDVQALSDEHVEPFCKLLGYSKDQFWKIMDKYCNKDICRIKKNGELEITGHKDFEEVVK
ncbi:MAG: N-acetyl sugar amidotransferase [Candidatus Omnitrophica bacterium]|nr:N-acetyl sugar amidotransferase [Candidatus Omnitrophota bacterium]